MESVADYVQDLDTFSPNCAASFAKEEKLTSRLVGSTKLIVRLAWGEAIPEGAEPNLGWFTLTEIKVFCKLWGHVNRILPDEALQIQSAAMASLPAEAPRFVAPIPEELPFCENCQIRASEKLSPPELKKLTLFSLRCPQYLVD
jgi:hypothetical protein